MRLRKHALELRFREAKEFARASNRAVGELLQDAIRENTHNRVRLAGDWIPPE